MGCVIRHSHSLCNGLLNISAEHNCGTCLLSRQRGRRQRRKRWTLYLCRWDVVRDRKRCQVMKPVQLKTFVVVMGPTAHDCDAPRSLMIPTAYGGSSDGTDAKQNVSFLGLVNISGEKRPQQKTCEKQIRENLRKRNMRNGNGFLF